MFLQKQFLSEEHKWLEKSFEHIITLESIALKVDSIFTLKHLDFLIERMMDKRFAEKVRKLQEMKQQMEAKNLGGALNYEETLYKYGGNSLVGKEQAAVDPRSCCK